MYAISFRADFTAFVWNDSIVTHGAEHARLLLCFWNSDAP